MIVVVRRRIVDLARSLVALARLLLLRASGSASGLVLVYHAVADEPDDPARTIEPALSRQLFERHLRHLRRRYAVVPAAEIVDAAAGRRRGRRFPIAITFDDDIGSHATVVAPLVRSLELPATFFLTGAGLDGDATFWWDDLQRAVDAGRARADDLPGVEPTLVLDAIKRLPYSVRKLAKAIEGLAPSQRDIVAARLRELTRDSARPALGRADVGRISSGDFDVGFHTFRHYDLRTLTDAELERAMHEGRERLADASHSALRVVAYPHGKADTRVAAAARRAGFEAGFTGEAKPVRAGGDRLRVGRLQPSAHTLGRFQLQLVRVLSQRPRR